MTKKELWHVHIGTKIKRTLWNGETDIGTVIHRQLNDEVCGFMIAKEKSTGKIIEKDFLTGKKYLTVTVRFGHRDIRYLETNAEQWRLNSYTICNE